MGYLLSENGVYEAKNSGNYQNNIEQKNEKKSGEYSKINQHSYKNTFKIIKALCNVHSKELKCEQL